MPFIQRLNALESVGGTETYQLSLEFLALRQELDEIRSAYQATRALLIAGTAVGAGYNVATNNIPPTAGFAALTAAVNPRFTPY